MSISFDWPTRLFCSFPNHDATLTVNLKFVFFKENAVMLEQKTQEQNAQARARERMWTEVSKLIGGPKLRHDNINSNILHIILTVIYYILHIIYYC